MQSLLNAFNRLGRWAWRLVRRLVLNGLPTVAVGVVVLGVLGVILWTAAGSFRWAVKRVAEWEKSHTVQRAGPAAQALFEGAVANGLVTFDQRTGQLRSTVDCRASAFGLAPPPAGAASPGDTAAQIVSKMCRTDIGVVIRQEIEAWNASGLVLAIRDNATSPTAQRLCAEAQTQTGQLYVAPGCLPTRWRARLGHRDGVTHPLDGAANAQPRADMFGFLANKSGRAFGDWLQFAPEGVSGAKVTLERSFDGTDPGDVVIQVIGRLTCVELSGVVQWRGHDATCAAEDVVAVPAVRIDVECSSRGRSRRTTCADLVGTEPLRPHAYTIRLPRPAKDSTLLLRGEAVGALPHRVRRLATAAMPKYGPAARKPRTDRVVALTNHIAVACHIRETAPFDDAYRDVIYEEIDSEADGEDEARDVLQLVVDGEQRRLDTRSQVCWLIWRVGRPVVTRTAPPGLVTIRIDNGSKKAGEMLAVTRAIEVGTPAPGRTAADLPRAVVPTTDAATLGLLPVLGLGESDYFGLIAQARRRVPTGQSLTLDLTIDVALQRIANETVSEVLKDRRHIPDPVRALPARYNEVRRAAVVLIDAGLKGGAATDVDSGRILAAATWPQVGSGYGLWDLQAVENYEPTKSPLAARAWSQSDAFNAPGSSFKPLIALVAADAAARGDREVDALLGLRKLGGAPFALTGRDLLGDTWGGRYNFTMAANKLEVPFGSDRPNGRLLSIGNFFDSSVPSGKSPPLCASVLGAAECAPRKGESGEAMSDRRLDAASALERSSNMYFARLALAVDDGAVTRPGPRGGRTEFSARGPTAETGDRDSTEQPCETLAIDRVLARLWPANAVDAPGAAAPRTRLCSDTDRRDVLDLVPVLRMRYGTGPDAGSRVLASRILIDATDPRRPRRVSLALNGIGQAAQATPLAAASIMASLASGSVVVPRLSRDGQADGAPHGEPLFAATRDDGTGTIDQALADAHLAGIRAGLGRVVRGGAGTARTTFAMERYRSLRDRVFGKTGTAQVGERRPNSAWFTGWIEGLGAGAFAERRIAFACHVTHINTRGATGGSVCAPLIAALLAKADGRQAELPPPRRGSP